MPSVRIVSRVNPSEDPDKVREAILQVFPDAVVETDGGYARGEAQSLGNFGLMIRRQKILDTARAILFKGMSGDRTRFLLNKQVAFVGKISFCDRGHVLGPIEVTVTDPEIEALIDRTAPTTVDGMEVRN
ncbi:MAG: RNA-binding domain-containing protein [Candidatus Methanomethylophilaceae archaeon]|jgi:hypothetical protein|nr:RNA-binding domain-containing protein [Candidatus Methanomethylophilaceae archaeon]